MDGSGPIVVSVVVPVFNEERFVEAALRRLASSDWGERVRREVIVVDDGSTDRTPEILARLAPELGLEVLRHERNRGKGAALHTGFAAASGDWVLVFDADLEYDPDDVLHMLRPVLEGKADVVYGSRFVTHGARRVLYFWHYVVNRALTLLTDAFANLNLTDMEVCLKLIRRDLLRQVRLREERFGFEPEVTLKLARLEPRPRFYEVGISYSGRTYEEGKKIGLRDGLRALWCIFRYAVAD